jgi:hypothetical protein
VIPSDPDTSEQPPCVARWVYGFSVWPVEGRKIEREVFECFENLKGRIEFVWTAQHFEKARSALSHFGLVMHEITRVPWNQEENVP